MNRRKYILYIAQYAYIILWGYSATIKLWNWEISKREMHLQPFANWIADILFWLVPVIEFFILLLLINRNTLLCGIKLSVVLLTIFTGYLFLAVSQVFGKIPCACGGILSNMGHLEHIFFNILFILIGVIAFVLTHKRRLQDDVAFRLCRKEDNIST